MHPLCVKDQPMYFVVSDKEKSVVAELSILDETRTILLRCSFNGCGHQFRATAVERIGMSGWCRGSELLYPPICNPIHGANHSSGEIGVPDKNLILTIPYAAVNVLRRMALRLHVDDNQIKIAALSLPSHPDEENIESHIDRLRRRIDAKLSEVDKMPQHFILDDTLWPKQSYIIQTKIWNNCLAVIC